MKISYVKDYFSIKKFNSIELPQLTILTGLNGSGKSHLLEAISNESINIEGIPKNEIVFFNTSTFFVDAEVDYSEASIIGERASLWSQFAAKGIAEKQIREQYLERHANEILELASKLGKSIYALNQDDFMSNGLGGLFNGYRKYLQRLEVIFADFQATEYSKDTIKRTLYKINKWIEEIMQTDVIDAYIPASDKNSILSTRLGKVFINYYDRWRENRENDFYNKEDGKNYPVLTKEDFIKKYGEPPWVTVNEILMNFSSLDYTVNYPERLERKTVFKVKLLSKTRPGLEIGFENLSSGEKTMLALVSSIYRSQTESVFPKVLLLDEIDASLHPSMTRNLFAVLNDIFVKKRGMSVVLVTHSPSTVALAPSDSIYLMNVSGNDRIIKTTPEEALNILTEGFASLTIKESGLRLNYALKGSGLPVVLTEGITDKMILEIAWQKLYNEPLPFEIQDFFDANSLRVLINNGEIFANYPNRKFIALFDFDEGGFSNWSGLKPVFQIQQPDPRICLCKRHSNGNGYAILLPVPDNFLKGQVIKSGNDTYEREAHLPIELLFYDTGVHQDKFIEVQKVGGGKIIEFRGDKTAFAENAVPLLPKEAFKNFEQLFASIKSLLK